LKKYQKIDLYLFTFTWISDFRINSCYTGEFVASQFAKIKLSQVTQINKNQTVVVVADQQESDEDKDKNKDEDAEDAVNSHVKLKRRGRPLGSENKKRI
jgi:predicted house-cleaning NTP pyrophosphatase (Maf/HAM1 superfamily)